MKIRIGLIYLVILCLTGCATSIGTSHLYRTNEDGKLKTPWEKVYIDKESKELIYKSTEQTKKEGSDIFSVFVSDAYFRYLPDLGGVNEVIIVAEFSEADAKNGEKLVKVLGPYKGVADMTKLPFFNKPIYGPKRLESNLLSMDIKVYEYDQEEKENNAAMLDFISDLGSSLSVSNPVTMAEIALAKKVAKAINDTNKNDLIMHADMTFIAGDNNLAWTANNHTQGLLLKAGELVLIKQEACQLGNCFEYFSSAEKRNPVALLADAVMFVPVTLKRGLTDAPDTKSLADMGDKISDYGVRGSHSRLYKDKTWLRINIIKGGDASHWEARKALWLLEKKVQEKIKNSDPDSDFASLTQALADAKKKGTSITVPLSINKPAIFDGSYYLYSDQDNTGLCLKLSQGVKLHGDLDVIPENKIQMTRVLVSPEGMSCYTMTPPESQSVEEEYKLGVKYLYAGDIKTDWFTLLLIPQPTVSKFECLSAATDKKTAQLTGTGFNHLTGLEIDGQYFAINARDNKTQLTLLAGKKITRLYTPAGAVKVSIGISGCPQP